MSKMHKNCAAQDRNFMVGLSYGQFYVIFSALSVKNLPAASVQN